MRHFWNGLSPNSKWAIGIFGALVLWFASGFILGGGEEKPAEAKHDVVPTVAVKRLDAQSYTPILALSGRTEAADKATVAAQTAGRVKRVAVVRGDVVKAGGVLVLLDPATRQSNVRSARANLQKTQKLLEAGRELAKDGYLAQTTLAAREADYLAAREQLAMAEQDLAYATIRSPIAGVVENTPVVAGDFVAVGAPVATVVRRDEILVVAFVGQEQRGELGVGSTVRVRLINGDEAPAKVRFVATDADPDTRTYRVEALIDADASHRVPTGMTATLEVPLAAVAAVEVSHSTLVLDDDGRVAVMTVGLGGSEGSSGTVAIKQPVTLLADTPNGVWLGAPEGGSLPQPMRVVVRGQNSIAAGSPVQAVEEGN